MGLSNPSGFTRTQKPIPPMGLYPAICYAIIDMGVHQESYQGNPPKNVQKVKFCFEFPTLPKEVFYEEKGPQRLSIMQDYNLSSGDKSTIMKMLKQWRNTKEVDLAKDLPAYLGAPCVIQVVHSTKDGITYANIGQAGLMVMPPMQALGEPENPKVLFDTDKFSWSAFHSLWKFVQDKLRSSMEWPSILTKYGPEPAVGQTQQQVATPVQQTVAQHVMQPNQQFAQQATPQQSIQHMQQAIPAAQAQVFAPTTLVDTQMPQSTGIVVGNSNTPPAF